MSDALTEAIEIQKNQHMIYDNPFWHRHNARLIQLIVTERRRHAEQLKDLQKSLTE